MLGKPNWKTETHACHLWYMKNFLMFTLCHNAACIITVVVSGWRACFVLYNDKGFLIDVKSIDVSPVSKLVILLNYMIWIPSTWSKFMYISWQVCSDYSTTLFGRRVFAIIADFELTFMFFLKSFRFQLFNISKHDLWFNVLCICSLYRPFGFCL